jgi:hypothetical protein
MPPLIVVGLVREAVLQMPSLAAFAVKCAIKNQIAKSALVNG